MARTGSIPFALVVLMFTSIAAAIEVKFDNQNFKYSEKELKSYVPPPEFRTNFTYYLSGYDDDGSPMWITEWGQWDIKKFIEEGGEVLKELEKFVDKVIFDVYQSMNFNQNPDGSFPGIKAIIDLDGYSYSQLGSFPTLQFYFKKFSYVAPKLETHLNKCYIINANFIAETGINMLRPIMGGVMEKIEIYGPNKAKWLPQIKKNVPAEILPEWYGGTKNFKPLKVFG